MIIKDIKQFAATIIPTAYKHNNFSSFVRQLNFYGFRKIKSESIDRSDWWEFRHPQFKRDQPHLLSEIKRSVHFETSNNQEVSSLKSEVTGLNDRIAALHRQIDALSGVVEGMKMKEEEKNRNCDLAAGASAAAVGPVQETYQVAVKEEPSKKRKVAEEMPPPVEMVRQTSLGSTSSMLPSGQELHIDSDNFFTEPVENLMPAAPSLERAPSLQRMMSYNSEGADAAWFDEMNMNMLDDIVDIDVAPTAASSAATSTASSIPQASAVSNGGGGAGAVQDISSILESLSPELKVRFVDKLAEVMGKQLSSNIAQQQQQQAVMTVEAYPADLLDQKLAMECEEQAAGAAASAAASQSLVRPPAVTAQEAPSAAASTPAHPHMGMISAPAGYRLPSGEQAPEIALPLASAALGAFVLSSLQSLVNTQQKGPAAQPASHIKEEVM